MLAQPLWENWVGMGYPVIGFSYHTASRDISVHSFIFLFDRSEQPLSPTSWRCRPRGLPPFCSSLFLVTVEVKSRLIWQL